MIIGVFPKGAEGGGVIDENRSEGVIVILHRDDIWGCHCHIDFVQSVGVVNSCLSSKGVLEGVLCRCLVWGGAARRTLGIRVATSLTEVGASGVLS